MSKAYGQRPSAWLLGADIDQQPGFAFDLDQTIFAIGSAFEAEQIVLAEQQRKFREGNKS